MRKIYFLFIIFLFSCSNTGKRVYICGDHPCKDKKEIEEYFKDNISIEVYVIESEKKKNKNRDLVELNIIKDKDYDQNKDKEFDFLRNRKDQKKLINKGEKPEKLKLKVTNTEKKRDQITKKSDDGNMIAEKLLRAEPDSELKRIAELSIEELDKEVSLEMDNT